MNAIWLYGHRIPLETINRGREAYPPTTEDPGEGASEEADEAQTGG